MTRVFITGDAGFIGHHVAKHYLDIGATVFGYDAQTDYYDPSLKQARRERLGQHENYSNVTATLEDHETLRDAIRDFAPNLVIHLAAQAGVRYSMEAPDTYMTSNIIGTQNLLSAIRDSGVQHLMLASTSSVYGGNANVPFAETDTIGAPLSLYAATKAATESLAHSHSHLYGTPITAFRFFTVYGPWGRPDMALFKFVRAIRAGESIDVYGYGKMKRDFTYIDDLVRGISALSSLPPRTNDRVGEADSVSPVAPFRVVNIGGGAPTDLPTFIRAIEASLGLKAVQNLLPMQPGDVVQTYADTTLLRALIGEIPSTPVSTGVRRFVEWYEEYYKNE